MTRPADSGTNIDRVDWGYTTGHPHRSTEIVISASSSASSSSSSCRRQWTCMTVTCLLLLERDTVLPESNRQVDYAFLLQTVCCIGTEVPDYILDSTVLCRYFSFELDLIHGYLTSGKAPILQNQDLEIEPL